MFILPSPCSGVGFGRLSGWLGHPALILNCWAELLLFLEVRSEIQQVVDMAQSHSLACSFHTMSMSPLISSEYTFKVAYMRLQARNLRVLKYSARYSVRYSVRYSAMYSARFCEVFCGDALLDHLRRGK